MSTSDGSTKPLDVQIGGDHYKSMVIQPMEYSMANKLDACQHTIIKYVTRFRDKGGIQDLEKAKHCIDLLIHFERQSAALSFVDEAREFIDPADVEPASAIDDSSERMQAIWRVVEPFEDMSDWRNWKAGDKLTTVLENDCNIEVGRIVTLRSIEDPEYDGCMHVSVFYGDEWNWPEAQDESGACVFKFHSRPSA